MTENGGKMPKTAEELLKLPGVGRYTAAAVASIAYGNVGGLVDGNVIRVLTRLRCIGEDVSSNQVIDHLWNTVNTLVDRKRPGDFNQALMELGAVVCTPKNPDCQKCPVKDVCLAVSQKEVKDIEDCGFCIKKCNFDAKLGLLNYPRKVKSTLSRKETTVVGVITTVVGSTNKYAMIKRPKTGLLANLLEFPSVLLKSEDLKPKEEKQLLIDFLQSKGLKSTDLLKCSNVEHIFSHINMTYVVYKGTLLSKLEESSDLVNWVSETEFQESGTSTAMKKVFKSLSEVAKGKNNSSKRKMSPDSKQPGISSYFSKRIKEEK